MAKFNQATLDLMKSDPDLFAMLSKELGIKPISLPETIKRNGTSLNQYSIVKLVADHLKKNPEDLLEEESEVKEPLN